MSEHRHERILKPTFFKLAPLKRGRSERFTEIIGFDSEADEDDNGHPFLYQFGLADGTVDLIDIPHNGRRYETLFPFLRWIAANCKRHDTEYVIYGFNLAYEYTQWFRDCNDETMNAETISLEGTFPRVDDEYDGTRFTLRAMNVKREGMSITIGGTKRPIRVIDAHAFYTTSLDKAAKMLGIGAKRGRVMGPDGKPLPFSRTLRHHPEFIEYARQDAILTQKLGAKIHALHEQFDITQTISAPHFSAKVFRHTFQRKEIPLPDPGLEQLGLSSYHGGKNGFYLYKPLVLKNVYHVDIRSAYPEAMRQLPDIEKGEWLYADRYWPGKHAIWHVTGQYKRCKYRALMSDTEWPRSGYFDGTVTGYELDQAIAHGEFTIETCEGQIFEGPEGGPLVEYVDAFYHMKRYATDPTEKATAKLLLNGLYGKFFQKTPQGDVWTLDLDTEKVILTDPSQPYDFVAGGLYHPPIASLITGYVRAKIHNLEHTHESVMTSTDGFFARKPPDPGSLGDELGNLSSERGTLRIWRERLYVFDADDGSVVYAMHGFRGDLEALRKVPMTAGNIYGYMARSVITLKMSTRELRGKRYKPGTFVDLPYVLQMPGGP
jgi:hypothetical protein